MRFPALAFALAIAAGLAPAQQRPRPPAFTEGQIIPLWENGAPGALGKEDSDIPTIAIYRAPQRPNGTSVIVAPGGGYSGLAMVYEGRQEAYWFNAMGVTAFVLKYRLGPRYHHPIELGDAQRAIRTVRARAAEFGVSPDRIGMMGFSAGGHLTSTAGTHFDAGKPDAADPIDRVSSRPDFLILAYPVISFDPAITHAGSVRNLLGDNPDPKLIENLSNELQVTPQTPPTFIFQTANDPAVPVENSIRFFQALRKAKVPVEMHIFENGPHGVGMALADPSLGPVDSAPGELAAGQGPADASPAQPVGALRDPGSWSPGARQAPPDSLPLTEADLQCPISVTGVSRELFWHRERSVPDSPRLLESLGK